MTQFVILSERKRMRARVEESLAALKGQLGRPIFYKGMTNRPSLWSMLRLIPVRGYFQMRDKTEREMRTL